MTVLVGWSGGLDSTWAVWDLLQRGPVRAHHVCLFYMHRRFGALARDRDRVAAERAAVKAMAGWLRERGLEIALSFSAIDWGGSRLHIGDVEMVLPHLVNEARGAAIAIGSNAGDYGGPDDDDPERRWTALAGALGLYAPLPGPVLRHGKALTRAEQIARMPPELVGMTMSCRRPRLVDGVWTPCGSRKRGPTPRNDGMAPCTCAALVDLLPRYANGWLKEER